MPHFASPSTPEIDRKSLKRPDGFVTALGAFFQSLFSRTGTVIGLAVAILAIVAAVGFYLNARQAKAIEAQNALFQARSGYEKKLTALAAADTPPPPAPKAAKPGDKAPAKPPEAPPADPSKAAYKKLDVEKEMAEPIQKFKEVISRYDGTRAAYEAKLAIGDIYFNHGSPAQAVEWYQKATDQADGGMEKALSSYSLGYALESTQKYPDAVKAYDRALNQGEAVLKGDLLMAKARSLEKSGDSAKARETYDQIISQMVDSDYAKTAQTRKSALR